MPPGARRRFSEADKRRIVAEADRPGASVSGVARQYGIAARRDLLSHQRFTSDSGLAQQISVGSDYSIAGFGEAARHLIRQLLSAQTGIKVIKLLFLRRVIAKASAPARSNATGKAHFAK
jgi:hypothetical protein